MANKVNQLLSYAQGLILKGWTKDTFARTSNGTAVAETHAKACRFCAVGALNRAAVDLNTSSAIHGAALARLQLAFASSAIPTRNDSKLTKKEHVYDSFTLAQLFTPKDLK